MSKVKDVLKKSDIVRFIWAMIKKNQNNMINSLLKLKICVYYKNTSDAEIVEIISFLKRNRVYLYNYQWYLDYIDMDVETHYDDNLDMFFFCHRGFNVYYNRLYGSVEDDFRLMVSEQDKRCPHCYGNYIDESEHFDVIIDAGVAEGMFSINYLHQANKVILVEGDRNWAEALNYTFAKQIKSGKVILINKYLSDSNEKDYITLDEIRNKHMGNADKVLIKMDIEGYEEKALREGRGLIAETPNLKIIACSYHHQKAEEEITGIFKEYGMKTNCSKGYIYLFPQYEKTIFHEKEGEGIVPLLRRALVIGSKGE